MKRFIISALCMLITGVVCLGQSKYDNQLQPGLHTRTDATRVLGKPVRTFNTTEFEYKAPAGVKLLVVEYRQGSAIIERIQTDFQRSYSRSAMIEALGLPDRPDSSKENAEGKLVEYFQDAALVLTYASGEAGSGVESLGYLSRELFDRVSSVPRRVREAAGVDASDKAISGHSEAERKAPEVKTSGERDRSPERQQYDELLREAAASIGEQNYTQARALLLQANNMQLGTEPAELLNRTYKELLDRAQEAIKANQLLEVVKISGQAVSLSPNVASAYELLGWAELYANQNFVSAEKAMRAAIDRNGNAQFSVLHDDGGVFQQYCAGILSIGKSGITYKSNNMNDSFTVGIGAIRETRRNSMIASVAGAFHIKILQQNGQTRNYNFIPWTRNVAESDMIVRLLKN